MKKIPYDFIWQRLATILSVAIVTLSLIATISGILMSFYYEPGAGRAYQALKWIDTEVHNGLLIHSIHNNAGKWLIGIGLIQVVVMFLGRQFRTSWLTAWISGILLTLTGMGLSWTAIVTDWSQVGYWRFRIELSTIEAIPFIGSTLRDILTGGGSVNTTTVEHLYTIHSYLLSTGAVILAIIHLWGLLRQEKERNMGLVGMPSTGELQGQLGRTEAELIQTP